MRLIKASFLFEATERYPKARKWVESWCAIVKKVEWASIVEVKASYPSADTVKVGSGHNVVVFNVCGNDFRLITAIHYNRKIIYTLRFLTHAEYSKGKWKEDI